MDSKETIVSIATPPGRGGVGVVRASGPLVKELIQHTIGFLPEPRYAAYAAFKNADNSVIDMGLLLYFKQPHSFTGEDVAEFHGHGGVVVLNQILTRLVELGARLAKPGEFSLRAFLNDKIDLTQAEAIADLINSTTLQAARSAMQTLQGEFSKLIHTLVEKVIYLRMYVEAAIDFPEEEIDFLNDNKVLTQLDAIIEQCQQIKNSAKQGVVINEGIKIVIAGKPNAGKSSLLNAMTGYDSAIVTDTPGTTRDTIKENIQIDGIPIHLIDTAGLRATQDDIEQEGIKRALQAINLADCILYIVDASQMPASIITEIETHFSVVEHSHKIIVVINKIDLLAQSPTCQMIEGLQSVNLSVKQSLGLDLLKQQIKQFIGFQDHSEHGFSARQRHLVSLEQALHHLLLAKQQLTEFRAGELMAEELNIVQHALNEITGEFNTEDLLSKIFSTFCIGK